VGAPGGGQAGRKKKGQDPEAEARHALADRIENNLTRLMRQVEEILRSNRDQVLCMAHALEAHKTLSGEDVTAVFEQKQGPVVDGRPYADPGFLHELEEYHQAAMIAHRAHGKVPVNLPVPAAIAAPGAQGAVAALEAPAFDGGPPNGDGPPPVPSGGWAPGGEWAPGSGDWAPDGGGAPDGGWAPDGGAAPGS
jgi:hypothetical protein